MPRPRTVVVGAGIVGLATAYFLSRAGRDVLVLDREEIGDGASCGNAGLLSIGHYPLTRPGVSWRPDLLALDLPPPLQQAVARRLHARALRDGLPDARALRGDHRRGGDRLRLPPRRLARRRDGPGQHAARRAGGRVARPARLLVPDADRRRAPRPQRVLRARGRRRRLVHGQRALPSGRLHAGPCGRVRPARRRDPNVRRGRGPRARPPRPCRGRPQLDRRDVRGLGGRDRRRRLEREPHAGHGARHPDAGRARLPPAARGRA
ncbi:MAG: FAD-binding oxidoreductase, partial [Actinobacteria bacterium]|nr:FAD-binding oxidoreductase [Actinomycetota bacterium]